jgi:translation elongation factor EF-1alpha
MRFIVDEITKVEDSGERRLILYGEVERGTVKKGSKVHLEILGQDYMVDKIRDGDKQLEEASAGEQVGVILKGVQNVRIQLGEVLVEASD